MTKAKLLVFSVLLVAMASVAQVRLRYPRTLPIVRATLRERSIRSAAPSLSFASPVRNSSSLRGREFLPTSQRLNTGRNSEPLKPGVYQASPYSLLVVAPGSHLDDGIAHELPDAWNGSRLNMPVIKPDLRLIPLR